MWANAETVPAKMAIVLNAASEMAIVAVAAEHKLASLTGRAQAAMARDSYSYIHLFMVFGIVLVALGLKKTLIDIDAPLKSVVAVALLSGQFTT